jgi:hypothetical protein
VSTNQPVRDTNSSLLPPFDPVRYERGWRLNGARLDQALVAYRSHREDCAVCPDLSQAASDLTTDQLCDVGVGLYTTSRAQHKAFVADAISQAHGTFVGLMTGQVALMFKEAPGEIVMDPAADEPINWLVDDAHRSRAFQVMLQYAVWGYDRVDDPAWSGEENWRQIARNLGYSRLVESSIDQKSPWSLKEAQLQYELAFHLHCETLEMRQELERDDAAQQASTALALALKTKKARQTEIVARVQRRDPSLFALLDEVDPGTAEKIGHLTKHYVDRVWWVLNNVEFTRPETAPYGALASEKLPSWGPW